MSLDSPKGHSAPQAASEQHLPTYGDTIPAQESRWEQNVVKLADRKDRVWATLEITSRDHTKPLFVEGDHIVGSLMLDLESGDPIHAVTVSVTGRVLVGQNDLDRHVFLDLLHTLWSRSMGNPRDTALSPKEKFSERLCGEYSWPFSISLPKEVTVSARPGGAPQTFRLPRTFAERLTKTTIVYELVVHISRSILRGSSQLQTPFVYIPITRPDPPSSLRQRAYREGAPLLGPDVDPDGWKSFSVNIHGKMFKDHPVEVQCTLALADPLCYTVGSVIPCMLALESQDPQALDVLSSPTAIILRIRRRIIYDEHPGEKTHKERKWKDALEHLSLGVWRSRTEGHGNEPHKRFLEGEIPLAKDLQPSSAVGALRIDYDVELFPFEATGFKPAEAKPLISETVEIATMFANGPRPTTFSPPAYDTATRPSQQGFKFSPNGFN